MASYKELMAQREELLKKVEEAKAAEKVPALAKVQELVKTYDITPAEIFGPLELQGDLFAKRKPGVKKGSVFPPKYRDPKTGATWSGRGVPPLWIRNQDREKFLIK
jgi:DNA-binding protein H-NS